MLLGISSTNQQIHGLHSAKIRLSLSDVGLFHYLLTYNNCLCFNLCCGAPNKKANSNVKLFM